MIKEHQNRAALRLHKKKDGSIFPVHISASYFTLQGHQVVLVAARDITELKAAEEELKRHRDKLEALVQERTRKLKAKSKAVEEFNVALKVLLRQVQEDKEDLEQRFIANVNRLVLPYLEKVRKSRLDQQQSSCLDIVRANINEIMSPFLHKAQMLNLTPREIQVANLIKDGKTTKEIAEIIGVAPSAIDSYRNSIRMKLSLNKKKVNLQTYLQSLT
jgi:DNA-binding CsgD family transcriptional regulator